MSELDIMSALTVVQLGWEKRLLVTGSVSSPSQMPRMIPVSYISKFALYSEVYRISSY